VEAAASLMADEVEKLLRAGMVARLVATERSAGNAILEALIVIDAQDD
jgi:hypothetical protein